MLLPIPELKQTIEKYKLWAEPVVSGAEYERTKRLADEFAPRVGDKLQEMLTRDGEIFSNTSWLHRHWLNGYLDGREAVTIGSNFAMDLRFGSENMSAEVFLPSFIYALGSVCKSYRDDKFGRVLDAKGNEISLNQFAILRGASRVPGQGRDSYNISDNNSDYATIFFKNNLYKVKIWDDGGHMLNFENAVAEILNHTRRREHSLSAICFADGDRAAGLRMKYIDGNAFFGVVENSLFNISITDEEFAASEDERHYFLYLSGENTWIYKPLNFIYNLKGGKFYINCEHTYQDAGTIVEICGRAFANMRNKIEKNRDARALLIDEYFDDAYAVEAGKIKSEYGAKIKKIFCKNLLLEISDEKLTGRSKDAVMQFLLQYAQLRTFGKIRGMYEAVDVRDYQYGRTECVRSVSRESVDFVKSLAAGDAKEKISEKFLLAEKEHKNRIKACKKAEGIDRHLFGLYMASKKLSDDGERSAAEEFFSDASYKKVTENFLSTTSIGCPEHTGYILFTPVAEKGMGVTYLKEPDGIRYQISYYVSESEKVSEFAAVLAEGLEKIKAAL